MIVTGKYNPYTYNFKIARNRPSKSCYQCMSGQVLQTLLAITFISQLVSLIMVILITDTTNFRTCRRIKGFSKHSLHSSVTFIFFYLVYVLGPWIHFLPRLYIFRDKTECYFLFRSAVNTRRTSFIVITLYQYLQKFMLYIYYNIYSVDTAVFLFLHAF